jgi:hypothetical protein
MSFCVRVARFAFVALPALTYAACDSREPSGPVAPRDGRVSAEVFRNEFWDVAFDVANTRTGGVIHVTGTEHYLSAAARSANGGVHSAFHVNLDATGIDELSGITYRFMNVENDPSSTNGGAQEVFRSQWIAKIVGPGPLNNLTARGQYLFVQDATGTIRLWRSTGEVSCG